MDEKRAKLMAAGMTLCFLVIHILMINVFWQCHVTPMVRINVFSIVFYVLILWVVHKGWLPFYTLAVYLEVAIHMVMAVIYTGWDSGFQTTLIGMNVLAFYAEYVGRRLKIRFLPILPVCLAGMFLYLGSYIYLKYHPAAYEMTAKAEFSLTILWGVIVFVINIFVLQLTHKVITAGIMS